MENNENINITLGEFREVTKNIPDDILIVLSSDSEGNGYLPLTGYIIEEGTVYDADNGDIGIKELTEPFIQMGYTETDVIENGTPCIVLFP